MLDNDDLIAVRSINCVCISCPLWKVVDVARNLPARVRGVMGEGKKFT